jgi:hypothetical protein
MDGKKEHENDLKKIYFFCRRRSSHRHYQHHHINPQGSSSQPRSASGLSKQLSLESENFKKYCTNPTREKQPGKIDKKTKILRCIIKRAELHFGQNETLARDILAGTLWPE